MLRFTIAQKTMELELLKQAFESFGDEDDASVIPQDSSSPCKQPTFKQQVPMTPPDDTTEDSSCKRLQNDFDVLTSTLTNRIQRIPNRNRFRRLQVHLQATMQQMCQCQSQLSLDWYLGQSLLKIMGGMFQPRIRLLVQTKAVRLKPCTTPCRRSNGC